MANLLIQQDPGLARRQRLAEAMLQRGQRQGPVKHWTEGLSRVLDTGMGAYFGNKVAQEQSDRQKKIYSELAQAISGTGMSADGMGPPQPLMSRIAGVEGVNPEAIAMMKLQQELKPKPRDPVADAIAIERGKLEAAQDFPKPESELAKLTGMLAADKIQADIDLKKQKLKESKRTEETEEGNIQTAANQLVQAVTHPGFVMNYGMVQGKVPALLHSQPRIDAGELINQTRNLLTVAARGQLKGQGQITEGETKMLRDAQTTLSNPNISDQAALSEVRRVLEYLQSKGADVPSDVIKQLPIGLINRQGVKEVPNPQSNDIEDLINQFAD